MTLEKLINILVKHIVLAMTMKDSILSYEIESCLQVRELEKRHFEIPFR